MKLSSYLDEKLIFENLDGNSIEEVINVLVNKVAKVNKTVESYKNLIEDAILKREHEISTAIGKGIAIPHARVDEYNDVLVVIGKLKNPIDNKVEATHTMDKVDLVFVIIAGRTKNKTVLKLMSSISRLAQKEEFLKSLRGNFDSNKVIKLIESYETDVKDRITAEDVMSTELVPAKLTDTLEEIATRLIIENRPGLPVVDDNGSFVGEITERELIEFGMPKYTSLMNDLSFMTVGEPFEEYFKNEGRVTVRELYRSNAKTIDTKASIMEISFIMVTQGSTRLYVVENKKYYGTIFRSDIIKKVLHI